MAGCQGQQILGSVATDVAVSGAQNAPLNSIGSISTDVALLALQKETQWSTEMSIDEN